MGAHLCKGGSSENDTDGRATLATPTYAREEAARTTRTDGQLSQRPPMQGRKQRERHGRTGNSRNAHLCKGGSSENDTGATLATPTYAREEAARTTRTDRQLSQRPPMQGRKQRERHGGNPHNAYLCKGGSSENDTDGRATLATPTYAREEAVRTTRTDGQLSQ